MPKAKRMMSDKLAYAIWRFLAEYPRRRRNGQAFQSDFATLLDSVKDYSIVARFEDRVETASGIHYKPDILVNVKSLKDTFIVFECKWGKSVDYNAVTAFCQKVGDLAHKNEVILFRTASTQPLKYRLRRLYRVLISLHKPSQDALGFCWGYGIAVFYRANLPEDVVPLRVIRHRLSLFEPSDSNEEETKNLYLSELSRLDEKMFNEAKEKPKDHRDFLEEVRRLIYAVNALINGRWVV